MNNDVGGEDASSVLYFLWPHYCQNGELLSLSLLLHYRTESRIRIDTAYIKLSSDNLFEVFKTPLIPVSVAMQLEDSGNCRIRKQADMANDQSFLSQKYSKKGNSPSNYMR